MSVVDVFPTVLDASGSGRRAAWTASRSSARSPPAERGAYSSRTRAARLRLEPDRRLGRRGGKTLQRSRQLFDLRADPTETHNLVAEGRSSEAPLASLRGALEAPPLERETAGGASSRLLGELRELGYVAAGADVTSLPDPLAPSDLPGPESTREEKRQMDWAGYLSHVGREDEAIEVFQRVRQANPRNVSALSQLGTLLMARKRYDDAAEALKAAIAASPGQAWLHESLGRCRELAGQLGAALGSYRRALEIDPADRASRNAVQRLRARLGSGAEREQPSNS